MEEYAVDADLSYEDEDEETETSGTSPSPPPPAHDKDKLLYKDFLQVNFRIKNFEPSTAHNWMTVHLGFKYCEHKKSYCTDRHEDQENKDDRGVFSSTHFEYERRAHRWIQITAEEAKKLEEEEQDNKKKRRLLKHIAHEYIVVKPDRTVIEMREYHVDSHPAFATYVLEENKKFGGNLSVQKLAHERPILIIGQDESIYRQFIFFKKGWVGAKGQQQLRPKDEGHGLMVSAFVSRAWSFFDILSDSMLPADVLEKVNTCRKNKHYKSTNAALNINGTTAKPEIKDYLPFLHFFEYGENKNGYWNYFHMALQAEDLINCLAVLYPEFDYVLLFDHSSGH